MAYKLDITVISGVSAGDIFHFDLSDTSQIVIGRDIGTQLTLQDATVSRRHALIERREAGFFIVDTNSSHGTLHMGFQLRPGVENGRRLESGDEFKIGETKFRVSFSDTLFQSKEPVAEAPLAGAKVQHAPKKAAPKKNKMLLVVVAVAVAGGAFLLLSPSGPSTPAQASHIPLNFPQFRVLGYLRTGTAPTENDQSHIDKVVLNMPTSDLLVEYELAGQTEVEILIDTIPVDRAKLDASWRARQLIVRDPLAGEERKLVIDNTEYPPKAGQPAGKPKLWGVRNLRVTPLTRELNTNFDQKLGAALGLATSWDKSPEGVVALVRTLQATVLEAMSERAEDGVGIEISLDSPLLTSDQLVATLSAIQEERGRGHDPAQSDRHVAELQRLVGVFDAEIWRRVNSRINTAKRAAKVKDYIEAHDALIAIKKMFPDEADYRWTMADKLLNDNNIVPAKVRAKPEKFRKAKDRGK